ncbi:response regulator [Amnibacterium kyonggiense]
MNEGLRVGVVEDDDELRVMIVGLLHDLDHEVIVAERDATDIVSVCSVSALDVVLLDQRLPLVSGLEAAANLARALPDLPVAILSAYDDRSLQEAARRVGVKRYLVKGCSAAELDAALRECVSEGARA